MSYQVTATGYYRRISKEPILEMYKKPIVSMSHALAIVKQMWDTIRNKKILWLRDYAVTLTITCDEIILYSVLQTFDDEHGHAINKILIDKRKEQVKTTKYSQWEYNPFFQKY